MESGVAIPVSSPHQSSADLLRSLSRALPQGYKFRAYHLSTPPSRCEALFSAPPDARPDRTYCENHFLTVAIPVPTKEGSVSASPPREVLVLALEILIYTTAYASTFFISKADSTGYLHLLNLPKGTPSPIREVATAFVDYLVRQRRRKGIQSIVSLFARAQGQYLFPGSVENKGKHVLTDRGLVKWWCKALTPLLDSAAEGQVKDAWQTVKGYLLVPGLDTYETRAFIPRSPTTKVTNPNWVLGHPLERISHYTYEYDWVPPRCLIARYPDDPKSRFRDELDSEAHQGRGRNGTWKSVHNLDQFWELMAFRQECSMGALTGFIWVVMDPREPNNRLMAARESDAAADASQDGDKSLITPSTSFDSSLTATPSTPSRGQGRVLAVRTPQSSPRKLFGPPQTPGSSSSKPSHKTKKSKQKKKKKLTGPIIPRQPRVKTSQRNYLVDRPVATAYYYWPPEGRGRRLVKEDGYRRSLELLLRLDFANLELAIGSTRRWVNEVGLGSAWGLDVVGTRPPPSSPPVENGAQQQKVSNLSGLVKRKQPAGSEEVTDGGVSPATADSAVAVNVLGAGLVRKKRKPNEEAEPAVAKAPPEATNGATTPPPSAVGDLTVNVLGPGLVRKKPKA